MTTMELLAEALRHMQRPAACSEEARSRIAALRVPSDDGVVTLGNGRKMNTNWRAPPSHNGSHNGYRPSNYHAPGPSHAPSSGPSHGLARRPGAPPRFGNRARVDVSVEERMMDRIRDKMNKFSEVTYDNIKGWLCQLLDSGETDFLTDFIMLVFEKAAAEPPFCALYARLITELRSGFPHLDIELKRIFGEFMSIFVEAGGPDVSSTEYALFLALRERRKFRRGYSAFLSEIAKLRVITTDDVIRTCGVILDGLLAAKVKEEQQLLCEEYADCLTVLMKSCAAELQAGGIDATMARVRTAMDKTGSPSLSNKARFALMDLTDIFI